MNEVKYYFRLPHWVLLGYIFMVIFGLFNIITIIIGDGDESSFDIIISVIYMLMFSCGLGGSIAITFGNKCYFTINDEGISYDEFKIFHKHIAWNSEIYYMITKSFFALYSHKNMIRLGEGEEIINEKNIKNGYISVKTEKALKSKRGSNKGWICIPTRMLKTNRQINDVVAKLNEYRRKNGQEACCANPCSRQLFP
jgi:hypothetical protein